LQPLAGMVVFTIVFRHFADVPSGGVPYPVFAFVGLTAWVYISGAVTKATEIFVENSSLITKVYFPRLLAPIAGVLPGLLDVVINLVSLIALMIGYGVTPNSVALLTAPLWLGGAILLSLGVGLWFGTLNVRYRDVAHAIPLFVQLWLFISPVAYPLSEVPAAWRSVYLLNPVAGIVEGLRWALIGTPWPGAGVFLSLTVAVAVLASGLAYFQRSERRFADVI
jgi:lipopolysaccharide transport system permease protein